MSSVETIERNGIVLAFGLEWFPLIGRHPERQARALARQQRATRHVVCGAGAVSVGLLRGRWRGRDLKRLRSAAAIFARMHPEGTVAAYMALPDGRRWLVGVHEGAVMARTDNLHEDSGTFDATLQMLKEAHPGLTVHDVCAASPGLLDRLFNAACNDGDGVLSGNGGLGGFSFRSGLLVLVCALAALYLGRGWPETGPPGEGVVINAELAWRRAVIEVAENHFVHGVGGLQAALAAMYELPLVVAGWNLQNAECRPRVREWQCRAGFRRRSDADNEGFLAVAPSHWTLTFDPLDGVEASWSRRMPALPLAQVDVRRPRENERVLVSALQAIEPAFSELRLDAPQAISPKPPFDAQNRPIPRPPGIDGHQRRAIRVQAPLRSISLLLPETGHMSWDRIVLQVVELDTPTLRGSGLRVSMSGVLYESESDYRNGGAGSPVAGAVQLAGDGLAGHAVRADDGA